MSSVNISALGNLTPSQALNLEDYPAATATKSAGSSFTLAPAGEYVLQAPATFPDSAFTKSQAGALMAQVDPVIVGPAHEGTQIRYVRVSATTFPRGEKLASFMADFVKSCGVTGEFPGVDENGSAQAQADAVAQCAGRTFRGIVDWEAKDRKYNTGITVKGMQNFPKKLDAEGNETGEYQSFIELPDKKDDKGRPARIWANLTVTKFITS